LWIFWPDFSEGLQKNRCPNGRLDDATSTDPTGKRRATA
jgi:hypothetical protein